MDSASGPLSLSLKKGVQSADPFLLAVLIHDTTFLIIDTAFRFRPIDAKIQLCKRRVIKETYSVVLN